MPAFLWENFARTNLTTTQTSVYTVGAAVVRAALTFLEFVKTVDSPITVYVVIVPSGATLANGIYVVEEWVLDRQNTPWAGYRVLRPGDQIYAWASATGVQFDANGGVWE